jgi:hypothetical protein
MVLFYAFSLNAKMPVSARQTAVSLLDALDKQDLELAKSHALSYEEFAGISKRGLDKQAYRQEMSRYIKNMAAQLAAGVMLKEVVCADLLIIPPGKKNKKEVIMAVIHASFQVDNQPVGSGPQAMLFISFQGKWKLFLR